MSWEGEVVPRVVPRPASPWLIFFNLQPHYFFFTLLLAHTKVHTDTQAGDGIWKRFPFPSNHSPLWDLSSCNPPGSTITQTLLFLTCSPRAIKPKRNPSTKDLTGKRTLQSGKSQRCHQFTFDRDVTQAVARSQSPRGVSLPVASTAILQPLPGSPPLWDPALLGFSGREVMKSAGAGRIFSSRPAVGTEKHIPFPVCVLKSWPGAGAGMEHSPSSAFAICRQSQEQREECLQAGHTLTAALLRGSALSEGARLWHKHVQDSGKGLHWTQQISGMIWLQPGPDCTYL